MTVRRVQEISSQIRAALALSEPDLDTTIGSVPRKMIDAFAEVVAEAYVDSHLLEYQYDIDSKTAADLDDFVRLFGFSRFPAKRAVGTVVFERQTPAEEPILIPLHTQLATDGTAPVVVQTTTPALLLAGETSVQVPAQAVVGGAQGNISSNALRRRITPIEGINSFTNIVSFTGGADAETDDQLRDRFKRTVFRNMAGTAPMFLGIALDDEAVTHANVIGATKRRRESVEIVGQEAFSTVQDAAYIYPGSQVFGPDIDNGQIFTPEVHYQFDHTQNPPKVTVIDTGAVPDGVYDLVFEYLPVASRNDPTNGITNRVDIYVNGNRPTEAVEVVVFNQSRVFTDALSSSPAEDPGPLDISHFERPDGSQPEEGNYFVQFAFAPVTDPSLTGVIDINGTEYTEGTHFFLVNDITKEGGTPNSLSGIEIVSNANGGPTDPTDLTTFQVNYIFNAVPRDIEESARAWRLITTDVRVHQAKPVRLNLYMAVILEQGYPLASVQTQMETELARFIGTIGFNGVVQVSDLMEVAALVPGVDAVRFLNSGDNPTDYAIQQVSEDGETVLDTFEDNGRATDVILNDDSYPVFNDLTLVQKAQNSFGTI